MRLKALLSLTEAPRLPWKAPDFIEKMKAAGINPASRGQDTIAAAKKHGVALNPKTVRDFLKFLLDAMVKDGSFQKWEPLE